jgi:flagellar protein FliT
MNEDEVLSVYEKVAATTERMLEAARSGNWDELIELESSCAEQVSLLRRDDTRPPTTATSRQRKVQIINKILEDDRKIRALTEPWMERLSALINSTSTERKLSNTYGAHQTG